jgi:aerobic-type carbon monoxide dehydrogenase small subunit (CoxS/CutS family)
MQWVCTLGMILLNWNTVNDDDNDQVEQVFHAKDMATDDMNILLCRCSVYNKIQIIKYKSRLNECAHMKHSCL